jgi:hypothetical protein
VARIEHHVGELFPRVGFIVTIPLANRALVRSYKERRTAEQRIKQAAGGAWCHCFRANEVRLQLSVLADNLGNLWRRLVLPTRIDTWSVSSLQQRLVKMVAGWSPCQTREDLREARCFRNANALRSACATPSAATEATKSTSVPAG